ncbi:MAG: ATPase, T2SS/T4P/T4SS family, partial [Candidatus Binatota bacterium]
MEKYLTLEERLVEHGLLSAEEMERIAKLQHEQRSQLARLVVELGFVSEDDFLPVLSEHLGIPLVSLKDFPLNPPVEGLFEAVDFLKFSRMVPLRVEGRDLLVATTDPTDLPRLHALGLATGLRVRPLLAKEKEITARIEALFGNGSTTDSMTAPVTREGEGVEDEEEVEHLRDLASEVPVIRMVNQMLSRALEGRASDIHIEPFENQLKVRYRIDGILHEVDSPPRQLKAAIISRLKILAQLNIAERRLPQDGRIKV